MAIPDAPTGITQGATTQTSAVVSWSPVAGADNYEYRVDGGGGSITAGGTSTVLSALSAGTSYWFEVRAYSGADIGPWSEPFRVETAAAPVVYDAPSCFSAVRGSAIRVTGLTSRGAVPELVEYVTSKSVIKVSVTDVVESGGTEVVKNPEEKRRLRLTKNAQTIRHKVDIEFLRVDPEMLRLVAGVELVYKDVPGFGEVPFGVALFGGEAGTVVGFDSGTTLRATSFALEVWSRLDNVSARPSTSVAGFDEIPFDTSGFDVPGTVGYADCSRRRWGYTLFPFLRGGRLSGFKFANGLVSFNLIGAQTRRNPGWGLGPHDLTGPFRRLETPVSRNTSWRMFVTEAAPPVEECGIQYLVPDVLDNGTAANPMPDPDAPFAVVGGGAVTDAWIIDGGRA